MYIIYIIFYRIVSVWVHCALSIVHPYTSNSVQWFIVYESGLFLLRKLTPAELNLYFKLGGGLVKLGLSTMVK